MRPGTDEAPGSRGRRVFTACAVLLILIVATVLRAWELGRLSFWYDEVVTMRLAETPSVAGLFQLLFQIDATRAPLHPLVLQEWLAVFGTSEVAGRSLSVVFGVATVALLYGLGRLAFDPTTGLWAAWLGAFSPLLVYYSREARMYALLTSITTLCWVMLFWNRRTPSRWKAVAYAACLVAMLFTHPLGLLMLGTLGVASALDVRGFFGSLRTWLAVHFGVLILAAAWLRHYFDHAPEFLSGRLSIKFLLATPIGFLGGDSAVYGLILALIAFGLYRRSSQATPTGDWVAPACMLLWLGLPPTILYAYSWLANPIFGPARYTLFCAPAYLVLVAQALARIPVLSRWTLGAGLVSLTAVSMPSLVFSPPRTDWRRFSAEIDRMEAASSTRPVRYAVMLVPDAESRFECATAGYYLDRYVSVLPYDEDRLNRMRRRKDQSLYLLIGRNRIDEMLTLLGERDGGFDHNGVYLHELGGLIVHRAPDLDAGAALPVPGRPAPAPEPAAPARPTPD